MEASRDEGSRSTQLLRSRCQTSEKAGAGKLCNNCADMDLMRGLREYSRNLREHTLYTIKRKSDPEAEWMLKRTMLQSGRCPVCIAFELASGTFYFGGVRAGMGDESYRDLVWFNGILSLHFEHPYVTKNFAITTSRGISNQFLPSLTQTTLCQPFADLSLARRYLEDCCASHDCCKPTQGIIPNTIPNLKLIDCTSEQVVLGPDGSRYAALSYVWGRRTKLFKLRRKPSFPQTIKDAILVTQQLGLKYLWVDAYCVEQKNPEMLRQQLQQMVQIYSQAEITIIASASSHSSDGLIGVSVERSVPEFMIDGLYLAEYRADHWNVVKLGPWASRGWTFQEGLYSRRRLFFTPKEMLFDCVCDSKRESRLNADERLKTFNHFTTDQRMVPPQQWHSSIATTAIYKLIEEYSRRELSFPTDILRAFAGLCNSFEHLKPPVYHHWGVPLLLESSSYFSSFLRGLLWTCGDASDQKESRRPGGFPSWSWVGWMHKDSRMNYYSTATDRMHMKIPPGTAIDVELKDGTTLDWASFEQRLPVVDCSIYFNITAQTAPVQFRVSQRSHELEFSFGVEKEGNWLLCSTYLCADSSFCRTFSHARNWLTGKTKVMAIIILDHIWFPRSDGTRCVLAYLFVVEDCGDHYERVRSFEFGQGTSRELASFMKPFSWRTLRIG
jgi:hypothetical protein